MPKEKKPEQNAFVHEGDGYILVFEHAPQTNGLNRFVRWVRGHGTLTRRAIADCRPDIVDQLTFEVKVPYDPVKEAADYWAERGATVKKVTPQEAEAYQERLDKDPDSVLGTASESGAEDPAGDEKPAEKVRVRDLAKELGLSNKELLGILEGAGIEAKSHASSVDAGAARAAVEAAKAAKTEGRPPAPHEGG